MNGKYKNRIQHISHEGKIKVDLKNRLCEFAPTSPCPGYGPVANFCEHCNEPSCFI